MLIKSTKGILRFNVSKKSFDRESWDSLLRRMLMKFAQIATKERGEIEKVCKALSLTRSSVQKMKSDGSGSVISWLLLYVYHSGMTQEQFSEWLETSDSMFGQLAEESHVDALFGVLKSRYTEEEVANMLRFCISKREVEEYIGMNVNLVTTSEPKKTAQKSVSKTSRKKSPR